MNIRLDLNGQFATSVFESRQKAWQLQLEALGIRIKVKKREGLGADPDAKKALLLIALILTDFAEDP